MKATIILIILAVSFLVFYACKGQSSADTITIKEVDVNGAKQMIKDVQDLVIIDARTPEEHAEGALPNAINYDVEDNNFAALVEDLDRETPYLLHCRSGKRSMRAAKIMKKLGFSDLTNLSGGYLDWQDAEKE